MDWMPPSSRVQPEEVEQGGTVFLSLFLRVESSPSADSFQDVARSIHYCSELHDGSPAKNRIAFGGRFWYCFKYFVQDGVRVSETTENILCSGGTEPLIRL